MLYQIILLIVVVIPCVYFSFMAYKGHGESGALFVGLFLSSLLVLFGINSLIINLLGVKINELNLLVIFGIESFVSIIFLIYGVTKNKIYIPQFLYDKAEKKEFINYFIFVLFILAAFYSLAIHQKRNGFTEFYFLQEENSQPVWQRTFSHSDQVNVKLVIECEELNLTGYSIIAYQQDKIISQLAFFSLEPGGSLIYDVVLPPNTESVTGYKFVLLKNFSATPYRTINIWIKRE